MKKKALSWLLALALAAGTIMTPVNVYAAEEVSVLADPGAESGISADDDSYETFGQELSFEKESDEALADSSADEEADEDMDELLPQDESADEEVVSEETQDTEQDLMDFSDDEAQTDDAASDEEDVVEIDEVSPEESAGTSEPVPDEDSAESSDSIYQEAELLKESGSEDPDIEKNEVGFICPDSDSTPGVTVKSKRYGEDVRVEIYASQNMNRSNEKLLGVVKGIPSPYGKDEDEHKEYLIRNTVSLDLGALEAGTWFIFGRFYPGEGQDSYEECDKNIVLTIDKKAPDQPEITDASGEYEPGEKGDGNAVFKGDIHGRKLRYGLAGGVIWAMVDMADEKFTASELWPGRYRAYLTYSSEMWFADTFVTDSEPVEFMVNLKPEYVESLKIIDYSTGEEIDKYYSADSENYKPVTLSKGVSKRIIGEVHPYDAYDTDVIYESSDPKVVSVDALGNCKALVAEGEATITISTKGTDENGDNVTAAFKVRIVEPSPNKIKRAEFAQATVNKYYPVQESDPESFTLQIKLNREAPEECTVSWSVDDKEVISVRGSKSTKTRLEDNEIISENEFLINGPGKAVVTAVVGGVKAASCTVNVDGTKGPGEPYFWDGKYLSGFCAFDPVTDLPVAYGNAALKKDLGSVNIRYYDDATHLPVTGTFTVGKKLYIAVEPAEEEEGALGVPYCLIRGNGDKDGTALDGYVINRLGELQTGWQKWDIEAYYRPDSGEMATSSWVPRGKGYTWVDADGLMRDDSEGTLLQDGIHTVGGSIYLFKGGLVQTGFAYFDEKDQITKAKTASYARYFNTPGGDLQQDAFMLDGKRYIPVRDGNDAKIYMSGIFASGGSRYYANKGAVVLGPKIVTDGNNVSYYVDKDGKLLEGPADVVINGRAYRIKDDGSVEDLSEGKEAGYYYKDADKGDIKLYLKFAKAGKPTGGTFFYSDADCKNKVTSQWIYKAEDTSPSLYLDKSGKPASGLVKIDGKNYFFDPDNGCELVRPDSSRGADAVRIIYKGKYYALDKTGAVITDKDTFVKVYSYPIEDKDDYYPYDDVFYVRVKKPSGELMTGVQSIGKLKYVFSKDAELQFPSAYGLLFDDTKKVKAYMPNKDIDMDVPESYYIYVPGKMVLYTIDADYGTSDDDDPIVDEDDDYDRTFVVNKDGSVLMNGWATIKNENNKSDKYYVLAAEVLRDEGIYKIGSKYYSFNSDGKLHTGWRRFGTSVFVGDVSTLTSKEYDGDFCFFFNEKTGALETGWKTMNTVKVDALGNIVGEVDGKVTGPKKKIYFNASEIGYYPVGALARNTDLTVSGKTYRFGADGSVEQGKESFVYGDPRSESFDGLTSYIKADGTMARGRTLVKTDRGDYYFYFSLLDGRKETGVLRQTGKKWYYYGPNGCMSTTIDAFHAGDSGESSVIANFRADGSIMNFMLQNGAGTVLKNTVIVLDTEGQPAYYLDKNGLPMTGMVKLPNTTTTVFYERDGSSQRSNKTGYASPQLRKIGKKYYMFINDILLNKGFSAALDEYESLPEGISYDQTSDLIFVQVRKDTFELLPSSDKAEADRCLKIFKSTPGLPDISIVLNSDGTVKSGDISSGYGSFRCNKLGIVMDGISLFVNKGGWNISSFQSRGVSGSRTVHTMDINAYSMSELILSWDSTGKLLPIIDKKTGKPATGNYFMDDVLAVISVKKGKLVTGKVEFMYEHVQLRIAIDKDYGIGILPFADD